MTIETKEVLNEESGKLEQIRLYRCNFCHKIYEPYKCDMLAKQMTSIHGEHVNCCSICHETKFTKQDIYWIDPFTNRWTKKE